MNPAKITHAFIQHNPRPQWQREWIKGVFGIMLRVARKNKQFTMDDIWAELDKSYTKGDLQDISIDHRILGPMLRHLVREGLIDASGYYVKSTRVGGGSRPITVWTSHLYSKVRVAA